MRVGEKLLSTSGVEVDDRHHRNTDCRLGSRKEHERTGKRAETQKKAEKKKAETLIGKEEPCYWERSEQ